MRAWAYTQRPLLVGGDYRDTGMHRTYDLALRFGVDPVRKLGQLFINPPPEGEAVSNRGRCRNQAEAGDVLVTDLAVDATGLYQAALQSGGCLAKAHKHDRSGITWSPTRCIFLGREAAQQKGAAYRLVVDGLEERHRLVSTRNPLR